MWRTAVSLIQMGRLIMFRRCRDYPAAAPLTGGRTKIFISVDT
jgi:hypothetical protein